MRDYEQQGVCVGAGIGNIQEIVDVGQLIVEKVRDHNNTRSP